MFSFNTPQFQIINDQLFADKEVFVSVLRLDMIHPFISGNKWYKLKYNIEEFFRQKKKYLATFGGAYSNHIIAIAAAGKEYGIETIGIIRGNELNENSNDALKFAAQRGMKLFFVSRDEYREMLDVGSWMLENPNPGLQRLLSNTKHLTSNIYFLPEGGSNSLAVKGCAEIVKNISSEFDFISCACGTGATLAGISTSLNDKQKAIGISVLNGEKFLEESILKLNGGRTNFQIKHDYSFGGYAKSNDNLELFCKTFFQKHNFEVELVYTGKLFFGLYDLIKKDFFSKGSRIAAIHSGGVFKWSQSSF